MPYYRARIRNATDTADALVVTSVPSGTNPFISAPPSGDGQGFNPRTGATEVGAYTVRIADNGGAANVITGFLSDGNGRYDKLGRRAYLEYGTDGTTFPTLLVAGYITALSYPSAAEAQVTVGEAQRAERTKQAFTAASTSFPATTMLGGGPVRWPAGVNPPVTLPNYGRWTVKRFDTPAGGPTTFLQFVNGWVLNAEMTAPAVFSGIDNWVRATEGAFPIYMQSRINTLTATEVPGQTISASNAVYRHGNVFADVWSGDTFLGTFHAGTQRSDLFLLPGGFFLLEWANSDPAGTQYQVYLYTRTVSENSPLHVLLHPVDVVTGLIDDAGELWDSSSASAVKASIGADVRVFLRITASEMTDAAIARIMGLFGFGRRINAANLWEFFDQRTKPSTAPATVITLDDLREIPTDVWALEDTTILNNVTVTAKRFAVWNPGQSSTRPPDGLVPVDQKRTARFQLADGSFPETSQGVKELTYDLPGTILNAQGAEVNLTDFTNALAAHAFDRWGYGAPWSGLVLRTNIGAQIGDEVLLSLNYLPNANVRGGQRIVQLVQRTNEAGGPVCRVEDSGTSAQPALAPTFSIVAGASNPRASADVALTNAAALAAAGVQTVLFEWIVSAGSPAVAGQDLGAIAPVAPVTLTTPQAPAGSKVWARAKSVQPGRRAGAFTAWAGVTLTGVGAPSSLTFTASPTDGSTGTLNWVAGGNSAPYAVRVLLRPSALTSASDVPVAQLLPNSVAAVLAGMTPGVSYVATVQYADPLTGIIAAGATLTLTAGASTLALQVPVNPVGVVGSTDGFGIGHVDGTYGLDVTAVHLPGVVEFWEAIETGVGTGTYGTAVFARALSSVSGAPTSYRNTAPNDGLRRQMTARHVATGATPSAFTTAVSVNPWGQVLLPSSRLLGELGNVQWTVVAGVTTITFQRNGITDSVWAASQIASSAVSPDWNALAATVTPLPAGATSYVVPTPIDGQVTLVQLEPRHADLTPGIVRRLIITATPQVPVAVYDDVETSTVGTQKVSLTERGIKVAAVQAQVQVETSQFTAFLTPTRGPGASSVVVPSTTLGANEYEQDVPLSAVKGRQSFIRYQWKLENGQTITSPDFAFDANKVPNIIRITPTQAVVSMEGDSDVQSWRVTLGSYVMARDGQFLTLDLSLADDLGNAGLAANGSGTFTIQAFNVPAAQQATVPGPGYRLSTSQSVFVYNGTGTGGTGGSPSATWATFTVTPPTTNDLTITLKATSAPVGWTEKLFLRDPNSATPVDITASTSPAAGTVPTVNTNYVYSLPYPVLPWDDPFAVTRYVGVVAQLWNAGAVVYSQTRVISYLASSAS